jgi:hypothetical protein
MRMKTSAASYLGRLLIAMVAAVVFWLNVTRAEDEGVFKNPPIWVLDAIPAALSHIFIASASRYTVSTDIADVYYGIPRQSPQSETDVNSAIAKVSRQDFRVAKPGYALLGNDDKGIVDFVELSFRVFGLRVESVATAYYALLLFSASLFYWRYWRDCTALAALTCLLFAEFQVLPYETFNPQLSSPLALRCLPILSLIACLHCSFHYWKSRVVSADLIALLLQALVITFVLHMRSTTIWQPLLLLVFAVIAASRRWYNWRRGRMVASFSRFIVTIMPSLLLVLSLGALSTYHTFGFPAEYRAGEQISTRVMWHNIYSGFALDPRLAAEHALRIDDWSIYADVGRALEQGGDADRWRQMGGETPNFGGIKWAAYDLAVRDVMLDLCRKDPIDCLETFVVYKPYYFFDTLLWFYGLKEYPSVADKFVSNYFGDIVKSQVIGATANLRQRGLTAAPWGSGFGWVLLALVAGLLLAQRRGHLQRGKGAMISFSMMALASIIPSILGYPAPHGMADSVVTINAAMQFSSVVTVILLVQSGRVDLHAVAARQSVSCLI